MPSGDAQRTWFPEMIATLRGEWKGSLSFTELIALCGRLDAMLQTIRSTRRILPPMMYCSKCGSEDRAAEPRVSVRAMILALSRFEIAPADEVKALEKSWKKYRHDLRLDLYGHPEIASALPDHPCLLPDFPPGDNAA